MPWSKLDTFPPYGRTEPLCSVCGSPQRATPRGDSEYESVYDTGTDIEFEGNFMICQSCIEEVAKMAGCLPPGETEKLQAELAFKTDLIDELQIELADLKELNALLMKQAAAPAEPVQSPPPAKRAAKKAAR